MSSELASPRARLRAALSLIDQGGGRRIRLHQLREPSAVETLAARLSGLARRATVLRLVFVRAGARPNVRHVRRGEHPVFVAERVPRATAAAWRAEGQSFVDLRGQVYLDLPGLIVDRAIAVARAQPRLTPATLDPFADRGSLVPRVLLEHPPNRTWGVRELAATAGVALGTASRVLAGLELADLISVAHVGRAARITVPRPSAVWRAWTARYDWTQNAAVSLAAPVGDPVAFLRRLEPAVHRVFPEVRIALTLQAGASLVDAHAGWDRVHAYVDVAETRDLSHVGTALEWPPSPEGGLVLLRPHYRRSAWHALRTVRGISVVSDLQLALDLWDFPVRGREQATSILMHRLPWILSEDGGEWTSAGHGPRKRT